MNRSLLFIPAKDKMLNKIKDFNADIYIIDLEDSIEQDDKEEALYRVKRYIDNLNEKLNLFIRINSNNYKKELDYLGKNENIGFMLPKFENIFQYQDKYDVLRSHKIIALIESPLGIVNISEIVKLNYVDYLAFGAEDFTAKINMENNFNNLIYIKEKILVYAKAYNKMVFDTPSFQIKDEEKFKKEVISSVNLGFDGKLLIHPKHIDFINKAFSNIDFEKYKYIINEFEKQNEAVVVIDGNIYENMHINRMKKILEENGVV